MNSLYEAIGDSMIRMMNDFYVIVKENKTRMMIGKRSAKHNDQRGGEKNNKNRRQKNGDHDEIKRK